MFANDIYAQQTFSPAWFAQKGATQSSATATGLLPNGLPANSLTSPAGQSAAARERLQQSITNLNTAAQAIALQQALQQQARADALARPSGIPDGLASGGLKVDENELTRGWLNANDPTQTVTDGKTTVTIEQTADKAILNWETFNVGRNTTVNFDQDASWAVLNRVNDPFARPSEIQGQINADGTVFILNRNGILFEGSAQVNVRNLVAAAANITDTQFRNNGLYVNANGTQPTFTDALGNVEVEAGAQITTDTPSSVTQGGGYVLLLGSEVHNAGQITTPGGQTALAAGDTFYIRKGVGTDGNSKSTTAGNEVSAGRAADSVAGTVANTGLITATSGDITLMGHDVTQAGVAVATTSVNKRGTIHLSNRLSDTEGTITLAEGSTTAIVLDESDTTALDSQRDAALGGLADGQSNPMATGNFDNLSRIVDRSELSRIEIVSGNTIEFQGDSLTLATGGEIAVSATNRILVDDGAMLDVSGAVGVQVAMEANNLAINVQGNELRDASANRDSDAENDRSYLSSADLWIDRRTLVLVPDGTNGYKGDRWYTAGGLLEVSGYLATSGHTVGEWMAQGGTVTVTGGDLVTRAGSNINLSGGTLDVATGRINQSWLKGADGQLYEVSKAPGDLLYTGLYRGFEAIHERWGGSTTEYYYNPLIAPTSRLENGYTVGRDAGKLVVATTSAVLEGNIVSDVYQGSRQVDAAQAGLEGYYQSQTAAARRGQLIVGQYTPIYDTDAGLLRFNLAAVLDSVTLAEVEEGIADGLQLNDAVAEERQGKLVLDTALLNDAGLGALRIASRETIDVSDVLRLAPGGEVVLHAAQVDVAADIIANSGTIHLGNVFNQQSTNLSLGVTDTVINVPAGIEGGVRVREGVALDASGLQGDLRQADADSSLLAYLDGGLVSIRSTRSVTLGTDSLIDVSAGAAVRNDSSIVGGQGGSVRLGAGVVTNDPTAVLTLDGAIRAYGVTGAGTLDIESGSAISIGGDLLETDGILGAGEEALASLILMEDYQVEAGNVLPVDYTYTVDIVSPGEAVSGFLAGNVQYTLAADWQLPRTNNVYSVSTTDGVVYTVFFNTDPMPIIPAGTTVFFSSVQAGFPTGYVVPGDVFPDGLRLWEGVEKTVIAGQISPVDFTVSAGTLLKAGAILAKPAVVAGTTKLDAELFQSGFAHYEVRGANGLVVPDDVTLEAIRPVLRPGSQALLPDSGNLLELWTPPLYVEDPTQRTLTQRGGVSLSLAAGDSGNLYVGTDAALLVDAGQSITLSSSGQLTVDGTLRANGGDITLLGPGGGRNDGRNVGENTSTSILLGEHAVLDVSAASHTAYDSRGRSYGLLSDGGRIVIGGELLEHLNRASASDAFVVIRSGALVDASGGQVELDIDGMGARTIVSGGGSIEIASSKGLYLEGALRAEAGGVGASGGRLTVSLDTPNYRNSTDLSNAVLVPRELVLVQRSGDVEPPQDDDSLQFGHALLGVDQVKDGGFSSLALFSNGIVSFGGDVDLHMDRELRIYSGALAVADGVAPDIKVSLSAPYVLLAGVADRFASQDGYVRPTAYGGIATLPSEAMLKVDADLIDIKGDVILGANGVIQRPLGGNLTVERAGFDALELSSTGDLRFVAVRGADPANASATLASRGDILLRAAQIYPATGVSATVRAGLLDTSISASPVYDSDRRLVIERAGTTVSPAVPYSVFGNLTLGAATIEQNGVLRAPLGTITLGTGNFADNMTQSVILGAGSETSVSATGLVIPYGGTVDGVTYEYLGREMTLHGVGSTLEGTITLAGASVEVQDGALLDLSGGGELQGAGFVSGRGGSTDARYHPLVQIAADGSFTLPGLESNPVYAIVPDYAAAYAPATGSGAVDPLIGQQITIGAGVPGLPAGTYTLLPSDYALLPGAYRVEINGSSAPGPTTPTVAMRNGSYSTSGFLSIAGTGIRDSLASQVILTSGDVLRTYSEYNETSYSDYVRQDATLNGIPRAILPDDGKQLIFRFLASQTGEALVFEGLADFSAAEGGRGGTVALTTSVNGKIEILGEGVAPTEGFDGISLHANAINAFGAARISIGANPHVAWYGQQDGGRNESNYLDFSSGVSGGSSISASSIVLREGAILNAPEIFLVTNVPSGGIVVEAGAGINTIGAGSVAYDSLDGFVYRPGSASVLAASNGWLDILPPNADVQGAGAGTIDIGSSGSADASPAQWYSEGTLLAVTNKNFELGESVRYGSRNLVLAVSSVNAGSAEALAEAEARGVLTPGLTMNQSVLDRLLQGDTAYGAPALERLVLTAGESFNFFGSVDLDTTDPITGEARLANLVLSAPALYGYGEASDIATITTDTFTWVGLEGEAPVPISGGRGTGDGRLQIDANIVEFGYGPNTQPSGVDSFDRLVLGFADVAFNAAE